MVQAGKEGTIYLLDRMKMGHYCSGCSHDTQIVQEIPSGVIKNFSAPAFWNNRVYFGGAGDHIKAFSFNANNSGLLSFSPVAKSSTVFGSRGTTPTISSNGTSNGILWALENATTTYAVLHAYNATTMTEIYNSNQALNGRDHPGGPVKFTTPVIANGKVYVGGKGTVTAFGLLP